MITKSTCHVSYLSYFSSFVTKSFHLYLVKKTPKWKIIYWKISPRVTTKRCPSLKSQVSIVSINSFSIVSINSFSIVSINSFSVARSQSEAVCITTACQETLLFLVCRQLNFISLISPQCLQVAMVTFSANNTFTRSYQCPLSSRQIYWCPELMFHCFSEAHIGISSQ